MLFRCQQNLRNNLMGHTADYGMQRLSDSLTTSQRTMSMIVREFYLNIISSPYIHSTITVYIIQHRVSNTTRGQEEVITEMKFDKRGRGACAGTTTASSQRGAIVCCWRFAKVQGSTNRRGPGFVNFVLALAYHFWLN